MPIYEYECDKCRHRFDKKQKFSDASIANCPQCHSTSKRVFCPAPIVFKGSGFYVTDYRGKEPGGSSTPSPSTSSS
jgi:putative FmdB family regulatory protein